MTTTELIISSIFFFIILVYTIIMALSFKKIKRLELKLDDYNETEQTLYNEMSYFERRSNKAVVDLAEFKKNAQAKVLHSFYVLKSGDYFIRKPESQEHITSREGSFTKEIRHASIFGDLESAEREAAIYGGRPLGIIYLEKEELTEEELQSIV